MVNIGGNITAVLQIKTDSVLNDVGERIQTWVDGLTIKGWLDFLSGEASFKNYNAKIQESTHVFVADYNAPVAVEGMVWNPTSCTLQTQEGDTYEVDSEDARLVIGGKVYDLTMMDNPMQMNLQWEFYLTMIGGVDSGTD